MQTAVNLETLGWTLPARSVTVGRSNAPNIIRMAAAKSSDDHNILLFNTFGLPPNLEAPGGGCLFIIIHNVVTGRYHFFFFLGSFHCFKILA